MAKILDNKKSTIGSPYVFYTVEATPSDRTATSVKLAIKITANLQYSSSSLGATYDLTCYLKFNGTDYSFKIKDDESWSGTTKHTYNRTITVNNLEPSATSLTGIKFWARGYDNNERAGYTNTTSCSSLTIPIGHTEPTDLYYSMIETVPSLIDAGIGDNVIVGNLSKKEFTIGATLYDGATTYSVSAWNGTSPSTNFTTDNPGKVIYPFDELLTRFAWNDNYTDKIPMTARLLDSLGSQIWANENAINGSDYYDFINYDKLFFNEPTSTIKRFKQTTGEVRANLNGQVFRGVIGNQNQSGTYKPDIQYKLWKKNETEPTTYNLTINRSNIEVKTEYIKASYNNYTGQDGIVYYELLNNEYVPINVEYYLSSTNENPFETRQIYIQKNSFSVTDYEIGTDDDKLPNHFNPDFAYNVRFKISDNFTTYESDIKSITVGEATWTEYKDRVDFKKITIKGKDVFTPISVPLSLLNSSCTGGCLYYPILNLCFVRLYVTGEAFATGSRHIVVTIPEEYRPQFRTALAIDGLQDVSSSLRANINTDGTIGFVTGAAKESGDDMYISGVWNVAPKSE